MLDRQVSGVAIVPAHDTPAHHFRPLQQRGVPVVLAIARCQGVIVKARPLRLGQLLLLYGSADLLRQHTPCCSECRFFVKSPLFNKYSSPSHSA